MKYLFLFLSLVNFNTFALNYTTAKNSPVKNCTDQKKYPTLFDCFTDIKEANHAFTMLHNEPTKYVALLVHGLSDSPYFFRDIATVLYEAGINVVAIRTSGNGTKAKHLKKATRKQWIKDIEFGKTQALKYGKFLIMGGMSLGGALVVHNHLYSTHPASAILNFSPAIVTSKKLKQACYLPFGYQAKKDYGVGVRYQKIANKATCQLYKLTREIIKFEGKNDFYKNINVPLFTVLTEYDGVLNMPVVLNYASKSKAGLNNLSHIVMFSKNKNSNINFDRDLTPQSKLIPVEKLPHASVLMEYTDQNFTPESNPHFDIVRNELINFIQLHLK